MQALLVATVGVLLAPLCGTFSIAPRSSNGFTTSTGMLVTNDSADSYCGKHRYVCTRRCCDQGENSLSGINCTDTIDVNDFYPVLHRWPNLSEVQSVDYRPLGVVRGRPCENDKLQRQPNKFYLLEDGRLYVPDVSKEPLDMSKFCVETQMAGGKLLAFRCNADVPDIVVSIVYPVCMVVTLPFLLATFIAYTILPCLKNLLGRALTYYVVSVFFNHLTVPLSQWGVFKIGSGPCIVTAYLNYFFFIASFFWLNVMCVDIWWTLSGIRQVRGTQKEQEHKKFIIYSIYAWGGTTLLLLVGLVMDVITDGPKRLGTEHCWFVAKNSPVVFCCPMALLVLSNIVFFVLTAVRLIQIRKQTAMLKDEESRRHAVENKKQFVLYLKLCVVMGMIWGTEVISFVVDAPRYMWYISDISSILHVIVIFHTLVWKKNIRHQLIKRLCPRFARGDFHMSKMLSKSSITLPCSSLTTTTATNDSAEMQHMKHGVSSDL